MIQHENEYGDRYSDSYYGVRIDKNPVDTMYFTIRQRNYASIVDILGEIVLVKRDSMIFNNKNEYKRIRELAF